MEHIKPLLIKFIYIAAITMIFLSYLLIPAVPLGSSLILALVATVVLYFVGDQYLLTRLGALPTAIVNVIVAAVILALGGSFLRRPIGAGVILATAAVIGVAEWIYFRYIRGEIGTLAGGDEVLSATEFLGGDGVLPEGGEGEKAPGQEEQRDGPEQ